MNNQNKALVEKATKTPIADRLAAQWYIQIQEYARRRCIHLDQAAHEFIAYIKQNRKELV